MHHALTVAAASAVYLFTSLAPAMASGPAGLAKDGADIEATFLVGRRATLAPIAFIRFCRLNPVDCARSESVGIEELTEDRNRELRKVNAEINRAIRPVNDRGRLDKWEADVAEGDCEDFALTKRRKLIALGWSPRTLRMAVARTPAGEGHAVLVVKTTAGDLVLDNRHSTIKPFQRTDLEWVSIQSDDNPKLWHAL